MQLPGDFLIADPTVKSHMFPQQGIVVHLCPRFGGGAGFARRSDDIKPHLPAFVEQYPYRVQQSEDPGAKLGELLEAAS